MTTTLPEPKLDITPEPKLDITPFHMSITEQYDSGRVHNIHLVRNDDLGVLLGSAVQAHPGSDVPPHDHDDTGVVVISLGVDGGDHDEVHFDGGSVHDVEELLAQAIEAMTNCRLAMRRVRRG